MVLDLEIRAAVSRSVLRTPPAPWGFRALPAPPAAASTPQVLLLERLTPRDCCHTERCESERQISYDVAYEESEVAQSCPTLCYPVDCSLPDSSLHGILQAGILEWVAISFSRESSQPRDQTQVSRIAGRRFNL